jgi:hypothetical protein
VGKTENSTQIEIFFKTKIKSKKKNRTAVSNRRVRRVVFGLKRGIGPVFFNKVKEKLKNIKIPFALTKLRCILTMLRLIKGSSMSEQIPDWIKGLTAEDFQFIKRLLLASGSLKEIATQYGISYPTVRIRLNRLIEKVRVLDTDKPKTKFHQTLQGLVADGKLDISNAKELLRVFNETEE